MVRPPPVLVTQVRRIRSSSNSAMNARACGRIGKQKHLKSVVARDADRLASCTAVRFITHVVPLLAWLCDELVSFWEVCRPVEKLYQQLWMSSKATWVDSRGITHFRLGL